MVFFEWNIKMETGIEVIDNQHRQLVAYVNQLSDAMQQGKGRAVVGEVLDQLVVYTKNHFALEERAFERYGYSNRVQHSHKHQDLIAQVNVYLEKQKDKQLTLSVEVLKFLSSWVRDHIMQEDMQYVACLKGKEIV